MPVLGREEVAGLRGLASLTEPGPGEEVAAVIDLAVIGARGDGKTQLIVHAIRTLRAAAPDLTGAELAFNREVMGLVMNAKAPRPAATAPGVVPHYVFRIRASALLEQLSFGGQASLLGRAAGLVRGAGAAFGAGAAVGAGLGVAAGPIGAIAGGAVAAAGGAIGWLRAREALSRAGDVEICLWDVAGEHVYSETAADYHAFLEALVRARRARDDRPYAFAPILVCNPLGLGDDLDGSPYARLKELLPLFASLDPSARALIAINRWAVVDAVCSDGADRDERVAIAARARGEEIVGGALPIVVRDVVRQHCRDAEDGRDGDLMITHLRYDAGAQCSATSTPWSEWREAAHTGRWTTPASSVDQVLEYEYSDGPGAFGGEARQAFLGWLGELAFPRRVRARALSAPPIDAPVAAEVPAPMLAPLGGETPPVTVPDEVWARRGGFGAGGT
ncbi:MAG TPA: hypothetical protein VL463_17925 [Kofleriaceae bacterium]|nr:hypothetical protein [Kofleriaceae bacterium]